MPEFVLTFIGIIGGLLAIAGAVYVAARPEMGLTPRKSWLAKPSGPPHNPSIAGTNLTDLAKAAAAITTDHSAGGPFS
jgi:hypothetical protein